jgi:hypothetical protein
VAGAPSAPVPQATSAAAAVASPGKFFGVRQSNAADLAPANASADGKSPPPIVVVPGPQGLTIYCEDLDALEEFERVLMTAAGESANGRLTVFYLKFAKAQAVADELDKILFGEPVDSDKSSVKGKNASRPAVHSTMATGVIKITPETRLNALLVLANRTDRETIARLLKVLDLKESPDEIALRPKPRMIAVEHARAKDVADVLRQVYADRVVAAQNQNQRGRGAGLALLMRGMAAAGRDQGQTPSDPAARISIGVDTRTNTLVIDAADPLFAEIKQLVAQLDTAAASENETVRLVTLHRTSPIAVEKAMEAFGGDGVQTSDFGVNAASTTYGNSNTSSSAPPWWASQAYGQGYGRTSGGRRSMGNNRPSGGSSSPFQGFGGQRGSRSSQPGRFGQ